MRFRVLVGLRRGLWAEAQGTVMRVACGRSDGKTESHVSRTIGADDLRIGGEKAGRELNSHVVSFTQAYSTKSRSGRFDASVSGHLMLSIQP